MEEVEKNKLVQKNNEEVAEVCEVSLPVRYIFDRCTYVFFLLPGVSRAV